MWPRDPPRTPGNAADARCRARRLLDLPADAPVLGTVGNLTLKKDQVTMLRAVRALHATREMSSHRTWDRLRQMYRLTGRYQDLTEVRELREQIRTALPAGRGAQPV